jgi:hypothetical protein
MNEPNPKFNTELPLNDDLGEGSFGEKKILETCIDWALVRLAAHKEAIEKMASSVFDLIILSPAVLYLSNLFQLAQSRNLPTSMLFAATLIQKLTLAFLRCWFKPALSRKNLEG